MHYRPDLLAEMEKLVEWGVVNKATHPRLDLTCYKYSQKCVTEVLWDKHTIQARGLVMNSAGYVVARGFNKFFNLGEMPGSSITDLPPVEEAVVMEKLDGSCILAYHYNGEVVCHTLGSFTSEQSIKADELLRLKYRKFYDRLADPIFDIEKNTWIFEILYPENRIVVDYGAREELVLIGVRTPHGTEVWPQDLWVHGEAYGFKYPEFYPYINLNSPEFEENSEGYVVVWPHHEFKRVKIKSPIYVRIHRLKEFVSAKRVLDLLHHGETEYKGDIITVESLRDLLPPEVRKDVDDIIAYLNTRLLHIKIEARNAYEQIKDYPSRKLQAQWIQTHLRKDAWFIVFGLLDGKNEDELLYKALKHELDNA